MNAFSVSSTLLGSINKQKEKCLCVALLPCGGLGGGSVVEENRAVEERELGRLQVERVGAGKASCPFAGTSWDLSG